FVKATLSGELDLETSKRVFLVGLAALAWPELQREKRRPPRRRFSRMETDADNHTEQTLNRILAAVESQKTRGWIEIFSVILLSLATMADAWCVFQSKVWMGLQRSQNSAASAEDEAATINKLQAFQIRGLETTVFVKFAEAKSEGNEQLAL